MPARYQGPVLLPPGQLAAIGNFYLRVKILAEGAVAGLHKSPYHGFSSEFLEHRPYMPGESSRHIDWRKYAKTDRTVVRLFEDETNLAAHLFLDKSNSMGFAGGAPCSKFEYARTLAGALAWLLIRQRDAAGLALFDERMRRFMPPRSTGRQLSAILTALSETGPGGGTRCGSALEQAAARISRRGLCIVFSDLFDDAEPVVRALRRLRFCRQDVLVFWVTAPEETALRTTGPMRLCDMETGAEVLLDSRTATTFLRDGMQRHRELIGKACRDLNIDLEEVSTNEPFAAPLLRVLEKRRRLL
jgi:uncharacterized protein (DUF58 family)